MKIFFAFLLIIFLAFSGYHLTFRHFKLPLFARKFYLTGTEFLVFGLLLGPQFLNIIDHETGKELAPLSTFLCGWIGLLFGLQFDIQKIKRFPIEFLTGSILESLLTFMMVFLGIYLCFLYIPHPFASPSIKAILPGTLTLAAAAACTAPTGIALMTSASIVCCQKTVKLLQYISSIDGIIALFFFGLAFFFRPLSSFSFFAFISWIFLTLATSACFIILFSLYLSLRRDESELILITLGMVVFIGGTAMMLNFSPLLMNFIVGLYLVNFSREKDRLLNLLIGIEKPVYLLLLIFLGVTWEPWPFSMAVCAAGYCLLRALGKLIGGYMITQIIPNMKEHPGHLGFGLLSPGGLPLAILLDFQKALPGNITLYAVSMALIAIIYSDILSPHLMDKLLKEKAEGEQG